MKQTVISALCIMVLVCSFSADARKRHKSYDCGKKVAQAASDYKAGKYSKVKVVLEDVRIQCSGNANMDTVYYYLGMSYLKMKQYIEARSELERIASDFPESPLFYEAKFRAAYAVYMSSPKSSRDQKSTVEAVDMFKEILETYPKSPVTDSVQYYLQRATDKLAEKELDAARFYVKMNEFESAVVYYKAFVTKFPDSKHVDESKYIMAELLLKLDRKSDASEVLADLIETGRVPDVLAKAKVLQNKIK